MAAAMSGKNLVWQAAVMFVMAVYATALTPTIRYFTGAGALAAGDTDVGSTLTQGLALAMVLAWIVRDPRALAAMLRPAAPYVIILVFCFASALWSQFPTNTLRRSLSLSVCILFGLYVYHRIGLGGMLRMFTRVAIGLAFLSIAVYFAAPSVGHDAAEGYGDALRGVFASKNGAGMAMMLAIVNLLYLGARPGANRTAAAAGIALAFGTLLLTRSATSLAIALVVLAAGSRFWLRSPSARLLHGAVLAGALLIAAFSMAFWPEAIFALAGRDADLTGRVPLWQALATVAQKRLLLGYGYNGFWNADSRDVQYLWRIIGWRAPNAHNGYIDIMLQIGVVGLLLYLAVWGRILIGAARRLRDGSLPEAQWLMLFLLVNVLLNIDEGPLPYPDQFTMFGGVCLLVLARAPARTLLARPRLFGDVRRPAWREGPV